MYSAQGGLRQDPRQAAQSSAGARFDARGADDVDRMITSVFDLPDHLAAKADSSLIAGDEQHFAAIDKALEESIADLSDRIDAARRESGGTDRSEERRVGKEWRARWWARH